MSAVSKKSPAQFWSSRPLPFLLAFAQIGIFAAAAYAQAPIQIAQAGDQSASAQAGGNTDSSQVEEIVVTAERRSESVQSAPLSITAVSKVTIEKFDIQDFADYAKLVPNLSFGMGVGSGGIASQGIPASSGFVIRGISASTRQLSISTIRLFRIRSIRASSTPIISRCCVGHRGRCSVRHRWAVWFV